MLLFNVIEDSNIS